MRRIENDVLFFRELIGDCCEEKDSKIYTISPQYGSGAMQSFDVIPGAEIIYSNILIRRPIRKSIQFDERFIEIAYCLRGKMRIEFTNQPEMSINNHDVSIFNGQNHLASCDFFGKTFVGVSLVIYLPQILTSLNIMLGTMAFDENMDFQELFTTGGCFVSPSSKSVEHIFTELLLLPEQYRNYLMRIKVMELLLYLVGKMEYRTDWGISLLGKEMEENFIYE